MWREPDGVIVDTQRAWDRKRPSAVPSPGSLDPCVLVTSSEASSLAGATFAAGKAGTTEGGANTCIYGSQTLNVFTVLVTKASDAATAQADWAQEQAKAQAEINKGIPAGASVSLNVADVSGVAGADKAAVATFSTTLSGQTVGITAIYLLKGAVFLTFSDLVVGYAPPATAAIEAQGVTSLKRLP
ncbi:MAG TPA: hypothetical protein VNF26_11370 [Candidatus Baltobacterales bacterium]|nr:hypothetical protein [Candidatus Baltobacterales bacterium]